MLESYDISYFNLNEGQSDKLETPPNISINCILGLRKYELNFVLNSSGFRFHQVDTLFIIQHLV